MNTAAKPALEATARRCPQCGSASIHRSRRRTFVDRLLTFAGGVIRRCQDCRTRQVWFGATPVPLDRADSPVYLWTELAVIGMGLCACLLFVLFIYRLR